MSFTDKVLLWLHIGFVIFTIGPVTAAMMASPRAIRSKNVEVLRHLNRTTRIFGLVTLGVFLFGAILGRDEFDQTWLSVSMTLFIVSFILLFALVERDQRKAVEKLANDDADDDARVQTGRIASMAGVISIIWLVILVLMIWR